MRFGATLLCGTIAVHVTLVVLFVFIKVNGEELGLQTVFEFESNSFPFSCFFLDFLINHVSRIILHIHTSVVHKCT